MSHGSARQLEPYQRHWTVRYAGQDHGFTLDDKMIETLQDACLRKFGPGKLWRRGFQLYWIPEPDKRKRRLKAMRLGLPVE